MKIILPGCILIIFFIINIYGQNINERAITRIRKDIFCGYQKYTRPVINEENTIYAQIHLALKHFKFEEEKNTLQIHCWVIWEWKDEFLKWNPKEYEDITEIDVHTFEIWTPDATLYTAAQMNFLMQGIGFSKCVLSNEGNVMCVVPTTYGTRCVPNLYKWPYDKHDCSLSIGSWVYNANTLNITLGGDELILTEYEPSNDWNLIKTDQIYVSSQISNKSYGWVKFDFSFQRHGLMKTYTIVAPAFALSILTLVSLTLDPINCNTTRVVICCCSLICHLFFLIYLGNILPNSGDLCPRIVLFFRDSMIVTLITLVVHLISLNMESIWLHCTSYTRINKFVELLLSSRLGNIFLLPNSIKLMTGEHSNNTTVTLIASGEDINNILPSTTDIHSSSYYHWKIILLVFERIIFGLLLITYCIFIVLFWI